VASFITPAPLDVEIRAGAADDADALADLFWQVRAENAATIPMVVHPRETVAPFLASVLERHGFVVVGGTEGDNEEGAPDLRMEWRPSGNAV
jgi:hypothetical protein